MYCSGDDVGAVVGDIGSYSCKLGFAGEDFPRAYFTSLVGRTVDAEATKRLEAELDAAQDYPGSARSGGIGGGLGSSKGKAASKGKRGEKGRGTGIPGGQQLSPGGGVATGMAGGSVGGGSAGGDNPADGEDGRVVYRWHVDSLMSGVDMDVLPVMEEGIVTNWDLLERLWEHGVETRLKVKLSDHPILLSEKPFNDSKSRMKYTEIMFEKFDVPAEFMSKDAVLASFSIGRTTAALADVGGDTMVVTPVVDGWVESKGIVKSLLGSNALQRYYLHLLDQSRKGAPIPPLPTRMLQALGGKLRPSLAERLRMDLARDMMTLAARTSDTPLEENCSQFANIPAVPFQLPDGTEVGIGTDRFRIPELLLNTDPLTDALDKGKTCPPGLKKLAESLERPGFTIRPLQGAVVDSVLACEREQQSSLFNGVVLAGGGCCFEGLTERVKTEIEGSLEVPNSGWRVKVLAAGSNERKISTWLGGSILGSLGSFHEMWLSKPEYHEHGAQMIDKKCP